MLQGGGALGAYQAGVYEALATRDIAPDWVAGISIGAINAALIAGNALGTASPHSRSSGMASRANCSTASTNRSASPAAPSTRLRRNMPPRWACPASSPRAGRCLCPSGRTIFRA
ncbi:patatin-like phospholipase family protein [Novosphingobium resinovorum]